MANTRIAAIALLLLFTRLVGQESPKVHLLISVTNEAGTPMPFAHITVDASSAGRSEAVEPDCFGKADLEVTTGPHVLSISCDDDDCWNTWAKTIDVQPGSGQAVTAAMTVRGTIDYVCIDPNAAPIIVPEQISLDDPIQPQPVFPLQNLPVKPACKRKWRGLWHRSRPCKAT